MPLRRKLLLAMLIPAILLGVVGAAGIVSLRHLEQAAGRILADNYQSIQEARRMEQLLRFLEYREEGGEMPPERPESTAAELATGFDEALHRCEGNITESGEADVLRGIRTRWRALRPRLLETQVISGDALAPHRRAVELLYEDLGDLVALNERAMFDYEKDTRNVARLMLGAVAGSAAVAIVALVLFALVSARRISRPVTEVADRLHVALNLGGDADTSAAQGGVDEIARLRRELDALLERLARHEDEHNRKLSHLQGRLAFVMDEVLEGLALLDDERRVLAVNRVARMVLGPGCAPGQRLVDDELRNDVREVLAPLLRGEVEAERDLGELRFEVDGEERFFRPRVLTVGGGDGAVEGYLLLFWDVTEQRRFDESRRRFISMLSHQLKTPMTSLSMSVNLLGERLEGVDPAQRELLAIATENCNSLATLVSDLIAAARDVTPDVTLKPRRVDIVRLLRSALRPLVPQAEEHEIEMVVPGDGEQIEARVDPVKFPWVVTNIAGNALRYTPRGGRVEVHVSASAAQIEVRVADTGAGIPAADIEDIFQPYVSLDREPQAGTHGLGLAIAKEIVEAHGGTIRAESEEGRGTEFIIRLPA